MFKATLTKEVCVDTNNSAGVASKLAHLVSDQAKANIRAAWAAGYDGKGHFSLITDNNLKVIDALKKDYPNAKEHEVVVVSIPNSIGKMAEVTDQLNQAGLNIDYLFTTYFDEKPAIVFSTNDNKKALDIITH